MKTENQEVGLVKWYGGYNHKKEQENNFGFIMRLDPEEDVFVHESELHCEPKELFDNTIVVFKVKVNKRNGKKFAANVRTLDLKKDDDIKLCLNTNRKSIWEKALDELIQNRNEFQEEIVHLIDKKLQLMKPYERTWKLEKGSKELLYKHERLRKYLDGNKQLKIMVALFQKSEEEAEKNSLLLEIKDLIIQCRESNQHIDENTWTQIPDELLLEENVWNNVPLRKKLELIIHQIDEMKRNDEDYSQLLTQLAQIVTDEVTYMIPPSLKREAAIFSVLPAKEQVETGWPDLEHYWSQMGSKGKILSIYRMVQEKGDFSLKASENEEDTLVKLILNFIENRKSIPLQKLFAKFDQEITTYINTLAMDISKERLNLSPLLPNCPVAEASVEQCEARRWRTPEGKWKEDPFGNELAFCPRLYSTCKIAKASDLHGAHFHSLTETSWDNWSLLELFDALDIKPEQYMSMNQKERYVLKLGGWVNRLNDIKKRLKCLHCKETLVPNKQYSKNIARYNVTVAYCISCSDKHVYLNHCWNCGNIIDSRESTIQHNGYYICIHCGTGPKPNYDDMQVFIQGSKCPRCGSHEMEDSYYDANVKECKTCHHKIHLRGKFKYDFITPILYSDESNRPNIEEDFDDFAFIEPF